MNTLTLQLDLRPALPNVYGTSDYREFRETLFKIDEILTKSDFEHNLLKEALEQYVVENNINTTEFYNSKKAALHYKKLKHALRCNIARHLTAESYRQFSIRLADSELFQWFTSISAFGCRKATSKSSLERYEKCFDTNLLVKNIHKLLNDVTDNNKAIKAGIHQPIDCKKIYTDSTCIKANIHFPVDWVLLRDAVRSLVLAINTIRAQGLNHRMIEPRLLLKQMNKLCIEMTHTRRKKDSKKQRKKIFRKMKKLANCIAKHGYRYRQLLIEHLEQTQWTQAQAQQVINRIDLILKQLPAAIKQAHERIIGERIVASKDKILSLYDKDISVIVRGKAGGEVEFGQGLLLTEQSDGLIIDWQLFKGQPTSDSKAFKPMLDRVEKNYSSIEQACTDRGFSDKNNDAILQERNIYNAICPKSPKQLQEKLSDPIFVAAQTRRSQSEGRIGIFKNVFLGQPLRSKISEYKSVSVNWCVLTHNLWVLSRRALEIERSALKKAA